MKKNPKLIAGLLMFVIIIGLINIIPLIQDQYIGKNQKYIYNDDLKIMDQGDSYSFSYKEGICEGNTVDLKFKFTGSNTLWDIETNNEAVINIDYSANISDGKFKVILITPENEIINVLEQSDSGKKEIKLKNGTSRIKMVALDAKGSLILNIEDNEQIILKGKEEEV